MRNIVCCDDVRKIESDRYEKGRELYRCQKERKTETEVRKEERQTNLRKKDRRQMRERKR